MTNLDTTTLYLVRHGEAHVNQPNADGSFSLIDRHGLTKRGIAQAMQLRDRLAEEAFQPDVVVTSSYRRAEQTASIVCEGLGIQPYISHEIQEWRPGSDAEVLPMGEAVRTWNRIIAGHDHDVRITPGSETHNEFLARADQALLQIADQHLGQSILVFTHGGVIGRSFVTFLDLPPQRSLVGLPTLHTSITEWKRGVEAGERDWRLIRFNDVAHLAADPEGAL